MSNPLHILIVEDHQLIIDSYVKALNHIEDNYPYLNFSTKIALCCDSANKKIEEAITGHIIDLVLLDISLPPSKSNSVISGDDLGIKLRQLFPKVKIIVYTNLTDNFRLVNILKNVKPNGLLLKNEIDFDDLTESILNVIYDVPHYSKPILKLVRQHISNDFNLDNVDRQILYYLSLGFKIKELAEVIPLSLAGIEKRRRRLHQIFNNDKKSNKVLLKLAKEKGFL